MKPETIARVDALCARVDDDREIYGSIQVVSATKGLGSPKAEDGYRAVSQKWATAAEGKTKEEAIKNLKRLIDNKR